MQVKKLTGSLYAAGQPLVLTDSLDPIQLPRLPNGYEQALGNPSLLVPYLHNGHVGNLTVFQKHGLYVPEGYEERLIGHRIFVPGAEGYEAHDVLALPEYRPENVVPIRQSKIRRYAPKVAQLVAAAVMPIAVILSACGGQLSQPSQSGPVQQQSQQTKTYHRTLTQQEAQSTGLTKLISPQYKFITGAWSDIVGDNREEAILATNNCDAVLGLTHDWCDSEIVVAGKSINESGYKVLDKIPLEVVRITNLSVSEITPGEKPELVAIGYRTGGNHPPHVIHVYNYDTNSNIPVMTTKWMEVYGTGDCLNVRSSPGTQGKVIKCIPDGKLLALQLDAALLGRNPFERDGYRWIPIENKELGIEDGWAADKWLRLHHETPIASVPRRHVFYGGGWGYGVEILDVDNNGLGDIITTDFILGKGECMACPHAVVIERYEFDGNGMAKKEVPRDVKLKYATLVAIGIEHWGSGDNYSRNMLNGTRTKMEELVGKDVVQEAAKKASQYSTVRSSVESVARSSGTTEQKARRLNDVRSQYGDEIFSYALKSYGNTEVSGIASLIEYVNRGNLKPQDVAAKAAEVGIKYSIPTNPTELGLFFLGRVADNLDHELKRRDNEKLKSMGIGVSRDSGGRTVIERDPQSGGTMKTFPSKKEADRYINQKLEEQRKADSQRELQQAEQTLRDGIKKERDVYGFSPAEVLQGILSGGKK